MLKLAFQGLSQICALCSTRCSVMECEMKVFPKDLSTHGLLSQSLTFLLVPVLSGRLVAPPNTALKKHSTEVIKCLLASSGKVATCNKQRWARQSTKATSASPHRLCPRVSTRQNQEGVEDSHQIRGKRGWKMFSQVWPTGR